MLAWLSTWVKALGRSMPAAPGPGLPRQPPSCLPRASAGTSPSSPPLRNSARPGGPGPALRWRRNTAPPRGAPGVVVPRGLAAHPGSCSSPFPGNHVVVGGVKERERKDRGRTGRAFNNPLPSPPPRGEKSQHARLTIHDQKLKKEIPVFVRHTFGYFQSSSLRYERPCDMRPRLRKASGAVLSRLRAGHDLRGHSQS